MAGIVWAWYYPGFDFIWLAVALILAGAALLWRGNFSRLMLFILPLAVVLTGYSLTRPHLFSPSGPNHILSVIEQNAGQSDPLVIGGFVGPGSGTRPSGGYRLDLETRELITPGPAGPDSWRPVYGTARLTVGGDILPDLSVGDYVRLPVTLKTVAGFKNPNGFDLEKYWGAQGIWVRGFIKHPALITVFPDERQFSFFNAPREGVANFIDYNSSPEVSGLLKAQLAGARAAVDKRSEEIFRALGLSHILSVSGLHLSLWFGLCFWLARLFFKSLAAKKPGLVINFWASLSALIPALAYAALAGSASAVLRAAFMIALAVGGLLAMRRTEPWNIIAAAAWAVLLIDPPRLMTASFQLSFTATLFLIAAFYRPDQSAVVHQSGLVKFAKNSWKTAWVGGLSTAPLVVWHFGFLPVSGLLANLVFTPILSALVLPPGLLALALAPVLPGVAEVIFKLPAKGLEALMPVMADLADLAGPGLMLPRPGLIFIVFFYLALWLYLRSRRLLLKKTVIFFAFLLAGLGLQAAADTWRGPQPGQMKVTVLDVGQGTAIHVGLPDGAQMIIDGGGGYNFDPGESIIRPYLLAQGHNRLTVAALTHPDSDHLKGLSTVSRDFKPAEIWGASWPKDYSPELTSFMNSEVWNKALKPPLDQLRQGRNFGGAEILLLWPPDDFKPGEKINYDKINDQGLVFKINYAGRQFLITGDISAKTERKLVHQYGDGLRSTVLLAPHHGSRRSLSSEFLAAVDPAWVIFSAGRDNAFGFPHPEALDRARAAGAEIWRTDKMGAAVFTVGPDSSLGIPADFSNP